MINLLKTKNMNSLYRFSPAQSTNFPQFPSFFFKCVIFSFKKPQLLKRAKIDLLTNEKKVQKTIKMSRLKVLK